MCIRDRDIPGLRVVRLTQNYRSTPEVLGCALPVICLLYTSRAVDAALIPEQTAQSAAPPDMERIVGAYGNAVLRMCFLYLKDSHLSLIHISSGALAAACKAAHNQCQAQKDRE